MNKKLVWLSGLSIALTVGVVACVSKQAAPDRNVAGIIDVIKEWNANSAYAQDFSGQTRAKALESKYISKHSSTGKLAVTDAELIIDNDASFDSKVEAIRGAQRSIRMSYFIYGDDDSSSVITSELIKKAKQGVKVKLLVDFITGYKYIDLFQMMTNEGNGNIDIRFYNFPSERIQADAKYMTLACPQVKNPDSDECAKHKMKIMKSTQNLPNPFFAQLFLAGMYGKNAAAMKVAIGMGAQLDPANMKSDKEMTAEEQAKLIDFLKLYYEAKIQKNVVSMIKLTIAMMMYGEELSPIVNELSGRLPLSNEYVSPGRKTTHAQEWDHLTDYTHHKLIVVDGNQFQLGGRNIEDSYHMKSRLGTKGKYIFMDTDFRAKTVAGGAVSIERSFDKTFNFAEMVAPIAKVQRIVPADLAMNSETLMITAQQCTEDAKVGKVKIEHMANCIEAGMKKAVPASVRIAKIKSEMEASVQRYRDEYVRAGKKVYRDTWRNAPYSADVNKLTANDLKTAEIYYVENTSFDVKEKDQEDIVRRTGSRIGSETFFNKHIHKLWYRGLENACYVSAKQKRDVRVVLHSAYLFMPSGMVHKITKMINGDYGDCSRVYLTLLTNSFETTDLNVINVFARYQMVQLFRHYQTLVTKTAGQKKWFPRLDYFEYNASAVGAGVSLHTKLSLLGDDMIVGSANADTRSYSMDTNNAVFIRNAHDLNREYADFVNRLVSDKKQTTEWTVRYAQVSDEQLKEENEYILGAMICLWDKKATNCPQNGSPIKASKIRSERFTPERIQSALETIDKIGSRVSYATYRILNFRADFDEAGYYEGRNYNSQEDMALEREFNKLANEFDDFFKIL